MAHQYQLPQLPYGLNDLEPVISGEIMSLHYNKHHLAYVTNLNAALKQYEEEEKQNNLAGMVALQSAIKFNGGGHINHSIFWTNLAPKNQGGGAHPEGNLATAIDKEFGGIEKLIEILNGKSVAIQGSGWGWLGYNKANKRLEVVVCENQDPLSTKGLIPLLGIDVWEHAYYLQYKNVRMDYLKAIWSIVNWKNVSERYEAATVGSQELAASAKR